jgi:alkylation response protein AidB-like acyl-CoA dehydrogenase
MVVFIPQKYHRPGSAGWELAQRTQGFGGTTEIQKEIIARSLGL